MSRGSSKAHNILVRSAVQTMSQLRGLCEDPDTPSQLLPHLECALETLCKGLMGQPMVDEKVVVGVVDGAPCVLQKTAYVLVEFVTQGASLVNETNLDKEG